MNLQTFFYVSLILYRQSLQELLSCGNNNVFSITFGTTSREFRKQRFNFNSLSNIVGNIDICTIIHRFNETQILSPFLPLKNKDEKQNEAGVQENGFRYVTKCDRCKQCAENILSMHDFFNKWAKNQQIEKMYIMIDKSVDISEISNNKSNIKFVYAEKNGTDTDDKIIEICGNVAEPESGDALRSFSKTSVLFVSISFIILMIISLAWLVFYYVQRFRYAHAKDRMQRRLFNAAKKALTKIPTKPVKTGDKELESDCPVCIDPYRAGDIVRILSCKHIFHKTCVDPWLLEHRTCPMCKSDILKAFGYFVNNNINRRREHFNNQIEDHNSANVESDRLSSNSTTSESNVYQFPVVSEIHDPFSFTPSTSPQLIQVMNETNARAFSIIPLTVHSSNNLNNDSIQQIHSNTQNENSNSTNNVTKSIPQNLFNDKIREQIIHVRSQSFSQSELSNNEPSTTLVIKNKITPKTIEKLNNNLNDIAMEMNSTKNSINKNKVHIYNEKSTFLRMAHSQENVSPNNRNTNIAVTRGYSVKAISKRQQPNKNLCRRISGQAHIENFSILSKNEIDTIATIFREHCRSNIESL